MKRACLLMLVVLWLLAGEAMAGSLSGSWKTTFEISPSALNFTDFIPTLTSKLTVDYALASWVFGAETTFDIYGLSKQTFTASGMLGAFTIDSKLQFTSRVATTVAYTLATGEHYQTQSVTGVTKTGTPASWTHSIWNCPQVNRVITYSPGFSFWQASAQTSLWGVNLNWLFYLKGNDFEAKTVSGKWIYGNPYTDWASVQIQTGSYTASACLPRYGFGSKFSLSGMVGDIRVTSRTYFNLEEYTYNELMIQAYKEPHLADTFTLSGSYYLPKVNGETCQGRFTREFVTFEGMSFGCADIDLGLNITYDGFDWLKLLVTDVTLSPALSFDALVTFETQSKLIVVEPTINFSGNSCFTFRLALDRGTGGFSLAGLSINGFNFSYTGNGITFISATSLNPVYESLGGYYLGASVNSPTTYGFFVPDISFSKTNFCVGTGCTAGTGKGYYKEVCYPEEYYVIWERLTVAASGDGCCGGKYQGQVNIYFGDRKTLIADSFWFWYKDEDGNSYQYNTSSSNPAVITSPTVSGSAAPYCEDNDVTYGVAYYNAPEDTLFGWVKTNARITVPVSSYIKLTSAIAVDVYGLEKLKVGFDVSW